MEKQKIVFQKLEREDLVRLLDYFRAQNTKISNFSAGFLYMWSHHMSTHFAEWEDCLILRDMFVGKLYFYYPISKSGDEAAQERALGAIEEYCREEDIRLHLTNVPREKLSALVLRYGDELHLSNIRRWRDYLYLADDFKTFAGGKYSGQRNHINKFKKTYPNYSFAPLKEEELPQAEAFLREYAASQYAKGEFSASEEMNGTFALLPQVFRLNMACGALRVGEKIVALSIGERCGDMLVVHVEKALREYAGAYPTTAQLFAQTFGEGVTYINREDDAGDTGLRKSKLQYLPVGLVDKYNLAVKRTFDGLSKLPKIKTARLTLAEVAERDEAAFAALCRDRELNRFWGYDWRQDAPETVEDQWFLRDIRNDFRQKNELPLGIYCKTTLVGEVVLHHFGYRAQAEIGMRVLPEWQGRGIAKEALLGLMEYGFGKLSLERIEAKCFKENVASAATLKAAGMRVCGEDETYFYFYKTAAM